MTNTSQTLQWRDSIAKGKRGTYRLRKNGCVYSLSVRAWDTNWLLAERASRDELAQIAQHYERDAAEVARVDGA
jgi:hypothetical protein